jgi:hypothetical protein
MTDGFLIETEVKLSNIPEAGNGRFFKKSYKKGTIVRIQKVASETLHVIKNVSELKQYNIEFVKHFGHSLPTYSNKHNDFIYLNYPPMNTNHSIDANIMYEFDESEKRTILIKDVEAGDEMVQNYTHFTTVKWFEDYLNSNNMISARQLGVEIN